MFDDIFRRPEPPAGPTTITFVCLGNICRSPLAEKVLRLRLSEYGVNNIEVQSAGLQAVVGSPMDAVPGQIAERAGADPRHVAKQLNEDLLRASSLVLTMTKEQRSDIAREYPFALKRIFTLAEFSRILEERSAEVAPPSDAAKRTLFDVVMDASRFRGMISLNSSDDIDDPYRRSVATHERVGGQIMELVERLARSLAPK
jgi:protein-tyrosine phosphatase